MVKSQTQTLVITLMVTLILTISHTTRKKQNKSWVTKRQQNKISNFQFKLREKWGSHRFVVGLPINNNNQIHIIYSLFLYDTTTIFNRNSLAFSTSMMNIFVPWLCVTVLSNNHPLVAVLDPSICVFNKLMRASEYLA